MARPDVLIRRPAPQETAQRQTSPTRSEAPASPVLKVGSLTLGEFRPGSRLVVQPLTVNSLKTSPTNEKLDTIEDACTFGGATNCTGRCCNIMGQEGNGSKVGKIKVIEVIKPTDAVTERLAGHDRVITLAKFDVQSLGRKKDKGIQDNNAISVLGSCSQCQSECADFCR